MEAAAVDDEPPEPDDAVVGADEDVVLEPQAAIKVEPAASKATTFIERPLVGFGAESSPPFVEVKSRNVFM